MTKPFLIGLTQEGLKEVLCYNQDTGAFLWLQSRGAAKSGHLAGSTCSDGYTLIKISGKSYKAHRLAWLYVHGVWPREQIDHINGNRRDNRMCNLREASKKQNRENTKLHSSNSTGFRGVYWDKEVQKFRAQVKHNGRAECIGYFDSAEMAGAAAAARRSEVFTHDTGRDRIAA